MKYIKYTLVLIFGLLLGATLVYKVKASENLVEVPEYFGTYKTTDLLSYVENLKATADYNQQILDLTALYEKQNPAPTLDTYNQYGLTQTSLAQYHTAFNNYKATEKTWITKHVTLPKPN